MREGVLIFDHEKERMDIRFGLLEYYGGLHCGDCLQVKIDNLWVPTRLEKFDFFFLVGIRVSKLNGLIVRICRIRWKVW